MNLRQVLLCTLVPVTLNGCFYPGERGKALEVRADRLEADSKELKVALADEQKRRSELAELAQRLDERLKEIEGFSRVNNADLGVQVARQRDELQKTQGLLEETQYKVGQLEKELKAAQERQPAAGTPPAAKGPEVPPLPADKVKALELADQLASTGQLDAAQKLYEQWLGKWSKETGAANAHFALGKIHLDAKRWREALSEFGDLVRTFPKADRAPAAWLRTSECFAGLGMAEEQRLALETLIKDFPQSQEAGQAKERLKKLPAPKKAAPPAGKKSK